MTILIEDSPRNLLTWIQAAVRAGSARGAVITPFATPLVGGDSNHRDARAVADGLRDEEAEVWFDPTTHALQMANVGDFRFYEEYDLWGGPIADLSTVDNRSEHLNRVFAIQDQLGAPHLAPAVLLHHGVSETSQTALDLSAEAVELDNHTWLAISGTSPFWASGNALDSHVGALAQLQPAGWFLSVGRTAAVLPADASAEEVHGLCRTVLALSEYAPVHLSHGDLAALPAVAVGADSVGTGWDQRQRICAASNYLARTEGGGGWYERPTLQGLLGSLKPNEATILADRDPGLATRLGPLPAPGAHEAFTHHVETLNLLISRIVGAGGPEDRYRRLLSMYESAETEWPQVVTMTGSLLGASDWITPFLDGLRLIGADEGW
jgi:hypothetical protein